MTTDELEAKWQSISTALTMPYRGLIIDPACIPELYLSLDLKGSRTLILRVPDHTPVNCRSVGKENLAIEWYPESRSLLIALRNPIFSDLFNDLTLSLYHRIKDITSSEAYTHEFIHTFHKWAEFFENANSQLLSEPALKGLFGELLVLRKYLRENAGLSMDQLLSAWQGPFGKAQDFCFPAYNAEVKTKDEDEVSIRISSEFQLETEPGKTLTLAMVNLIRQQDGITIRSLIGEIRAILISQGGDIPTFMRLISRSGLNFPEVAQYDPFIWKLQNITFFDAGHPQFPRIIRSALPPGISQVSYQLNVVDLTPFLTQTYTP